MVAIVVAWRRRRGTEPWLLMVAAAAVVWYVVAEATPLKRGGDVERYVLPCAPLSGRAGGGLDDAMAPVGADRRATRATARARAHSPPSRQGSASS